MHSRFFWCDAPGVHQTLYEGVVGRHLFQNAVSQSVNPGVTNVSNHHLSAHSDHGTHCCAHAGELWMIDNSVTELFSCLENAPVEAFSGVINRRVGLIEFDQVFDGDCAGDITTRVTAHTVGHDIEVVSD